MMVECVSADSWLSAALGRSDVILVTKRVPRFFKFRVYVGNKRMPTLVDGKTRFVSLGCEPLGFGVYACKVRVCKHRSV